MKKRFFLFGFASLAAAGVIGSNTYIRRQEAKTTKGRLLIDPDGENFVYSDGWIVKA